jgi:hypothetical protein
VLPEADLINVSVVWNEDSLKDLPMAGVLEEEKIMRLSTSLAFVSLILIALIARQGFAQIDPSDIAGAWLFDEGSGSVATDLSANGNDGMLVGAPVYVAGVRGTGVSFGGGPDKMDAATVGFPVGSDDRTLAFWVTSPNFAVGNTWLAGWGSGAARKSSAMIMGLFGVPDRVIGFWGWDADVIHPAPPPEQAPRLQDDTWYHVAFTYSGTTITTYLDGEVWAQGEIAPLETDAGTIFSVAASPFGIMGPITATFDEVVVLNAALSQADVRSLMDGVPGGPVGVPALPHWALLAMPALLALAGALVLGRRRLKSRTSAA